MTDNIIVMPGSGGVDYPALHTVAGDFGWAVDVTHDLSEVAAARTYRKTVAALYYHDALGPGYSWLETTRLLRIALPGVRLVVCHGFSESIDWPELCDAGAFQALGLPLKENEVRLSLGFVWEAENRLAGSAERLPDIMTVRSLRAIQRITAGRARRRCASSVLRAAG